MTGAFCVILTAKGSVWNFPFGIYSSIAYACLSFKNHLYAETASCILLSVPATVISFFAWKKHSQNSTVEMKKLSVKKIVYLILTSVIITFFVGTFLSKIKNQNNPFLDGSTVIISNIARVLKILRFREQWIAYTVLNITTVVKWTFRLKANSKEASMMILMWGAYFINSIYAFFVWTKGADKK
jgi:nicotinamide mononucleotide transporter PnuC